MARHMGGITQSNGAVAPAIPRRTQRSRRPRRRLTGPHTRDCATGRHAERRAGLAQPAPAGRRTRRTRAPQVIGRRSRPRRAPSCGRPSGRMRVAARPPTLDDHAAGCGWAPLVYRPPDRRDTIVLRGLRALRGLRGAPQAQRSRVVFVGFPGSCRPDATARSQPSVVERATRRARAACSCPSGSDRRRARSSGPRQSPRR